MFWNQLNNMKNIEIYLPEYIRQHYILSFMYGSYVYGTNTDKSDEDIIVIFNTAPAVRVALGEEFQMDAGSYVEDNNFIFIC